MPAIPTQRSCVIDFGKGERIVCPDKKQSIYIQNGINVPTNVNNIYIIIYMYYTHCG